LKSIWFRKTTVALHAVASAKAGGIAAFVDAEHALTTYAAAVGVDITSADFPTRYW